LFHGVRGKRGGDIAGAGNAPAKGSSDVHLPMNPGDG
jgi:hypothetical protein